MFQRSPPLPANPSPTQIEARFQAGLQLQRLYSLPIYQLPAEIMLNILNRLQLDDYPAMIAATWHLLRHKGIAPLILTAQLKEILIWPRTGFFSSIERAIDPLSPEYLPSQVRRLMISRLAPRPVFFSRFTNVGRRLRGGFQRLPAELIDHVFNFVDPENMINVALAAFRFSDRHIEWLTHEEV